MSSAVSSRSYYGPATYLPPAPVQEFAGKHLIYGPGQPCTRLYLVRSGRVIIRSGNPNTPVVTRIVGSGGLFGEAALVVPTDSAEAAVVLDRARVMAWSRSEIEQHIARDLQLGLSLAAYFAQRCVELNTRLEALTFHKTQERVMLALLQLADALGTPHEGAHRMAPLTHQTIAEFVGTTREVVTSHMTDLRRAGLLDYSRKYIDIQVAAMRDAVHHKSIYQSAPGIAAVSARF